MTLECEVIVAASATEVKQGLHLEISGLTDQAREILSLGDIVLGRAHDRPGPGKVPIEAPLVPL
jgi:hypothetical protein